MTKPKTPTYPRPVSPLNAEPLRTKPGDIYLDDSSDSCGDSEQRRAKRRRIEKLGEAYLRGDGLSIMTASLKGPWTGWVSPWSKQNGKAITPRTGTLKEAAKEEAPKSTLRIFGRSKNRNPIMSARQGIPREPSLQGHKNKKTLKGGESWLKTVDDHDGLAHSERDDSPTPIRKHDYVRSPNHRSSTKVSLFRSRPQSASACSRIPAAILRQAPEDKRDPTLTLSSNTRQDSKPTRAQPPQLVVPAVLPRNEIPTAQSDRYSVEHVDQQITKLATPDRTPRLSFESKHASIHELPPSTHLPEVECRLVADSHKSMEKPKEQDTRSYNGLGQTKKPRNIDFTSSAKIPIAPHRSPANDEVESEKQAGCSTLQCEASNFKGTFVAASSEKPVENRSVNPEKIPPPLLSTQTSTTTTNVMPSAQIVPAVQASSAESYPSIGIKLIEHEISPTSNKGSAHNSTPAKSALPIGNEQQEPLTTIFENLKKPTTNGATPHRTKNIRSARSRLGIVPFSTFKSPSGHSAFNELDTQEMLAAITPLGFSTVRKIPPDSVNKSTPPTVMQVNPKKGKKRASFAPMPGEMSSAPSQGSIKGSLKVSKVVDKPAEAGKGLARMSQPSPFGKLGLDMETSDEEGGRGEAGSLPGVSSLLRGETHPQVAPTSPGHLGAANTAVSTGSAQQQDAQPQIGGRWYDGQNGYEKQDNFNLTNAIDDLGSFLGTWDADKEAKEFGSGTSNSCMKSALKSRDSMSIVRG